MQTSQELKEIMAEKYAKQIDRLNELSKVHKEGDISVQNEINNLVAFLIGTDEFQLMYSIEWVAQFANVTKIPTVEEVEVRKDFEFAVHKASQNKTNKYPIEYKRSKN